ncbi:uncharacterized protein F5891DRAFT_1189292 [Suillus fuscotomentosus]|uniref:Uncharacterized protein n=1 Tax=Suillus fuscotomentosus TaxID=1912939 RepID=A0AAD4E4Z6_9AGAM|nr:uncharacterized protein F5891DRAFT_1189292 [Suillus fuscotomentosus]KAG1899829.1 hypothetical protein F5891DRAFT_1189292 [Suillus fuscotomentosus]
MMITVPPLASKSLGVHVARIIISISPNNNLPDYAHKPFCMTENMNMPSTTTPLVLKPSSRTLRRCKTAASVLKELKTSPGGFYAAMPRLAYRTEYFSGRDGNILITKGLDHDEEFIIHSVFKGSSIPLSLSLPNIARLISHPARSSASAHPPSIHSMSVQFVAYGHIPYVFHYGPFYYILSRVHFASRFALALDST